MQGQSISVPTGSAAWAAIDTGTTGIAGPTSVLTEIYAAIPGSQPVSGSQGFWSIREFLWLEVWYIPDDKLIIACNTDFSVTMRFGNSNINWAISADDFRLQQLDDNTCVGAFFALPSSTSGRTPSWVVGDTFLVRSHFAVILTLVLNTGSLHKQKNVYSVFRANPPSVGFAPLSSTAISLNDPNLPVPSPTTAPTPNSVGGGGGGSSNGAPSALRIPGVMITLVASALFGAVMAVL